MKVLIVEDTEDSRVMLAEVLGTAGYQVALAANGREAMALLQGSRQDLIVSDIMMPEMDGFELCRAVKTDKRFSKIPFIFYTATYTEERDRQLALAIGAEYYMLKPEDPDRLLDVVRRVLSGETMGARAVLDAARFTEDHARTLSVKLDKKILELETERELLQKKEAELRLVTDSVPLLISRVDASMRYVYVNRAYEQWHGVSRRDIIGSKVEDVNGQEAWKVIRPHLEQALAGQEVEYDTPMTFRNGDTHYIWVHYVPYSIEGQVEGVIVMVNDVTDFKRAEAEKEKLQQQLLHTQKVDSLGHLASGIAHDFNNILTGMVGYSELALNDVAEAGMELQASYLRQVVETGMRARELITQMLSFTRGNRQPVQVINVKQAVESSIRLIGNLLPSSMAIETSYDSNNCRIRWNEMQFQQVIMNMAINARDAMNGKGKLLIAVRRQQVSAEKCSACGGEISGRRLVLEVSDSGRGMSTEVVGQIFDAFYSTKTQLEGTGLGLAVVNSITHANGGHIVVKSEEGKGSVFSLLLEECADIIATDPPAPVSLTGDIEGKRFVVVDDDASIANYIKELLGTFGAQVQKFTSAGDALKYIRQNPEEVDMLITDNVMPGMSGVELSGAVHILGVRAPIMVCTGNDEDIGDDSVQQAGISSVFMKPFSAAELLSEIHRVMAR